MCFFTLSAIRTFSINTGFKEIYLLNKPSDRPIPFCADLNSKRNNLTSFANPNPKQINNSPIKLCNKKYKYREETVYKRKRC